MNHKTTNIVIDGNIVDIDNKLLNLVKELNSVGLKTRHSCEGDITLSDGIRNGKECKIIDNYHRAYVSIDIEASHKVQFEFKDNRLVIRWILIPESIPSNIDQEQRV